LSGGLFGLVNISHKEGIRNLIHGVSIGEDRVEVKQKGAGVSVAVRICPTLYSAREES